MRGNQNMYYLSFNMLKEVHDKYMLILSIQDTKVANRDNIFLK